MQTRLHHLLGYVLIVGVGAAIVLTTLKVGQGLDPAETVAGAARSAGAATAPAAAGAERLTGAELAGRMFLAAAVVILLARLAGALFRHLQQPPVVGEILAGIFLGPSAVGALVPDLTDHLFAAEVVEVIRALAQLGVVLFMFLVGLELDIGSLRSSGHAAVLVSHASIVAPLTLGVLAALVLYPLLGHGEFTSFALFMGAAMSITAFPVLARILTDTGLERTPLGTLAVTCAAIDDVTAWCVLSVVIAISQASGAGEVIRTVALSLGYVAVMFAVVRPLLRRWMMRPSAGPGNHLLGVMLTLVLMGAWATEEIGIHAIFGAFLVGVVVPRDLGVVETLTAKLEDVTRTVLLPLFFVVAGLSTRIGLIDTPLLWAVALGVIVLAVLGKWGGSTLAARACRLPRRDAAALGILMNARGLTELVILTIGLELGIISDAVFTVMVVMALVTTVMTVPGLRCLGVVERFERAPRDLAHDGGCQCPASRSGCEACRYVEGPVSSGSAEDETDATNRGQARSMRRE